MDAIRINAGRDGCYAVEDANKFQGFQVHSLMAKATVSADNARLAKTMTRRENYENHLASAHSLHILFLSVTPLAGRVRIMACGLCDEVFWYIDARLNHV